MNARQLEKLGVPIPCVPVAIRSIQNVVGQKGYRGKDVKEQIAAVVENPQGFLEDEFWGALAESILEDRTQVQALAPETIAYPTWGTQIDPAAHMQMRTACQLPIARAAALMPDAHLGYGCSRCWTSSLWR